MSEPEDRDLADVGDALTELVADYADPEDEKERAQQLRRMRARDWAQEQRQRERLGDVKNTWEPQDVTKVVDDFQAGKLELPKPSLCCFSGGCLFYRGRINGLIGESESGKSWLGLYVCKLELDIEHVVYYVDFEDDQVGIVGRLLAMGAKSDMVKTNFRYIHPDVSPSDDEFRQVLQRMEEERPSVIIVDSTGEWHGLAGVESNSDTAVAAWAQRFIKRLVRCGAAVILLDHLPHENRGLLRGIGSQRKQALITGSAYRVDVVDGQRPGRLRRGVLQLVTSKDRHGHRRKRERAADVIIDSTYEREVAVTLQAPHAVVSPELDVALIAVNNAGTTGLTVPEVARAIVQDNATREDRNFAEMITDQAVLRAAERTARRRLDKLREALLVDVVPAQRGGTRGGLRGGTRPERWIITSAGHDKLLAPPDPGDEDADEEGENDLQ